MNAASTPSDQLVLVLDRLLRIVSIYDADHPSVVRAAEPTLALLRDLRGKDGETLVQLADDGALKVAGVDVPASNPAVRRLRELLEQSGLHGVAFATEVSTADLCAFGRHLRSRPRHDAETDVGQKVELPTTIRSVEAFFGVPGAGGLIPPDVAAKLHEIVRVADGELPLSPEEMQQMRETAESALAIVLGDGAREQAGEVKGEPRFGIRRQCDVRVSPLVAIEALRKAIARARRGGQRVVGLREMLAEMREVLGAAVGADLATTVVETALETSKRFLVDRIAKVDAPVAEEFATSFRSVVLPSITHDVIAQLGAVVEKAVAPTAGEIDCGPEYVSIQLDLLASALEERVRSAIERRLAVLIDQTNEPWLDDLVRDFVVAQCAAQASIGADRAFPLIAGAMRHATPPRFARLLADALERGPESALEHAWPHLVSELVLGLPPEEQRLERRLLELLLRTPRAALESDVRRLASVACAHATLAPGPRLILRAPKAELFPVFLALLAMPGAVGFGELVMRAFRENAPELPAARAFLVLRQYDNYTRTFLQRFLQQARGPKAEAELHGLAARLLVDAIQREPAERRGEKWIAEAIQALQSLPSAAGDALLERVVGERNLWLRNAWPEHVRRLAKAALDRRRNSGS